MKTFFKRLKDMLLLSKELLQKPYYQGFAAQISFYFIMSLVPSLLIISQVAYSVFQSDWDRGVAFILNYLKDIPFASNLESLIAGNSGGVSSIVFLVVALWSASKAQFSLIRLANYTMSGGEFTEKNFFRERIKAMLSMMILLVMIIFAIVVLLYGEGILLFILGILSLDTALANIWLILRWPLAIFIYFLMISYIYYILPSMKVRYKDIIPGSIFASTGLLIVTYAYSIYVKSFAKYNILYGSMANIIAILLWFFFLAWVLCIGMLFNKSWIETKDKVEN